MMKNFNVFQASAGSGKTFTLVKEYLKLCLKDEKSLDNYKHILAVTFTNKAAGEMKARILSDLLTISQNSGEVKVGSLEEQLLNEIDDITAEQLRQYSKTLFHKIIHDYSNLCLSTIDAFTQKLARSFPKELNLPYQYSILLDNDEISESIIQLIGDEIGEQNEYITKILVDFVIQNLEDEKKWSIEKHLGKFICNILSEDAFLHDDNKTIIDEENYSTIRTEIYKRISDIEDKYKTFIRQFDEWKNKYNVEAEDCYHGSKSLFGFAKNIKENNYKDHANSYVMKMSEEPEMWASAKGKSKHSSNRVSIGNDLHSFLPDFVEYYNKSYVILRILKLLRNQFSLLALHSQINNKMEEYIVTEQQVHISEFNKRIAQILSNCSVPFIYERMGEKYRHIFIDEFQDTSILQWRNFLPLISNSLAEGNANLIVGDGKQAIYRFRSGEVEQIVNIPLIYNKPDDIQYNWYEKTLQDNFKFHSLDTNYRSFKKIVEFNNEFYEYCYQKLTLDRLRKVYKSHDSDKEVSIKQNINKTQDGLVQIDIFDKDKLKNDKEAPYRRIISLVETLHQHYNYKDITILCRGKKHGSRIANYLNKENIPVMSADSIILGSSNEVQLIVNTLSFLNSRNNPATIANILYFRKITSEPHFSGILNDLFSPVAQIAEGKDELETYIGLQSHYFDTLLSKAYSLYDLCSALIRAYDLDSITDPFIAFFLEDVQTWQGINNLGIKDFIEYWERHGLNKSIHASEQIDAVNIMTVHKAKGLAFKVVIFPIDKRSISNKSNTKSQQWLDISDLKIPHIKNALMRVSKTELSGSQWEHIYTDESCKTELDELNICYVATTRPIEQLYILTNNEGANNQDNIWMGFLADKEEAKVADEELFCTYKFGEYPTNNKKTPCPPIIVINSKSASWDHKVEVDPDPTMFWKNDSDAMRPQDWGNLVHDILSKIDNVDNAEAILRPYVVDGTLDSSQAQELKDKFIAMSDNDIIKPAFSQEATIKNECSLYSTEHGILRPDRYAELPDKIFIIDYKTGAEHKEHHQQLQRYASVLKTMTDKPITAYLLYIQHSQDLNIVEVKL